ncbi:hypothetical protein SAMN05421854_101461 [Amycolatopsis rubida]|uniref:Uncharacterized protein n=1 Tax=Amycolatopsis rubida TaxID=112413 RepID=A0A1I5E2U0_9PSEU|nr:hypothetical protein SAMN05421854_101461 [Amycolatopsis rubida]
MKRRTRAIPLLTLLARLGWQRDRQAWTVPCRDEHGRRGHVRVSVDERGPQITLDQPGAAVFDPLASGRLRAALREAIEVHARLSEPGRERVPAPRSHPGAAPTPHREVPAGRHSAMTASRVQVVLGEDDEGEPSGRHALTSTPVAISEAA